MSPLRVRIEEPAAVEHAEVDRPERLAVHVPGREHADRAEHRDDAAAVGDRRGVRLARLGVALDLRRALECLALPEDLASRLVQAVDLPGVLGEIVDRRDVAVEPRPEGLVAGAADGGDDEDAIAPDHGAGVRDAGDRGLPADVLLGVDVPLDDRALAVAVARGVVAAEAGQLRAAVRGAGLMSAGGAAGGAAGRGGRRGRAWPVAPPLASTPAACFHDGDGALDHAAASLEIEGQAFALGDAKAGRRVAMSVIAPRSGGRRERQLIAVQRER